MKLQRVIITRFKGRIIHIEKEPGILGLIGKIVMLAFGAAKVMFAALFSKNKIGGPA
jgi:hypothetical protein